MCDIASFALGADIASFPLSAEIALLPLGAPSLIGRASEESAAASHHIQSLKMSNAKTTQASILLVCRYPAIILTNDRKTFKRFACLTQAYSAPKVRANDLFDCLLRVALQ